MGGIPILGDILAPPAPKPPKLPPAAPPPPTPVSPEVIAARQKTKQQAGLAAGATIKTGPQGLNQPASTTKKTVLGV